MPRRDPVSGGAWLLATLRQRLALTCFLGLSGKLVNTSAATGTVRSGVRREENSKWSASFEIASAHHVIFPKRSALSNLIWLQLELSSVLLLDSYCTGTVSYAFELFNLASYTAGGFITWNLDGGARRPPRRGGFCTLNHSKETDHMKVYGSLLASLTSSMELEQCL